jgi:hypothetical protein
MQSILLECFYWGLMSNSRNLEKRRDKMKRTKKVTKKILDEIVKRDMSTQLIKLAPRAYTLKSGSHLEAKTVVVNLKALGYGLAYSQDSNIIFI